MANDNAPVSELIIERNTRSYDFPWQRWRWLLFVDPPKLRASRYRQFTETYAEYSGYAISQKRALEKAMKLVPRYVRTQIR